MLEVGVAAADLLDVGVTAPEEAALGLDAPIVISVAAISSATAIDEVLAEDVLVVVTSVDAAMAACLIPMGVDEEVLEAGFSVVLVLVKVSVVLLGSSGDFGVSGAR